MSSLTPTQRMIKKVCDDLADFLIDKNRAYGSSFSEPINIFSQVSAREQLAVRIDDKLNRLHKGAEYAGDDTVLDLAGYLVLLRVLDALEVESASANTIATHKPSATSATKKRREVRQHD